MPPGGAFPCGGVRRTCGDFARMLSSFACEAAGAVERPAFPALSVLQGAMDDAKPGHQRVAGRTHMIASGCRELVCLGPFAGRRREERGVYRSPILTIFWRCGRTAFSSRNTFAHRLRQRTVNGFGRGFWGPEGSGDVDSQAIVRSSGRGGIGCPRDSGCVGAHPAPWRASASYRPLRAVWAICAWALRGCARTPKPFSAQDCSAPTDKESWP